MPLTLAEQAILIGENVPKVFQAGYEKGLSEQNFALENKTITENGHYIPGEGFSGFGQIDVQVTNADTLSNFLRIRNGQCLFANISLESNKIKQLVEDIDCSTLTTTAYMFQASKLAGRAPEMDLSTVTATHYMFESCGYLTEAPFYDLSKVTYPRGMFKGCSGLKTIPEYDLSNGTDFSYMFNGCASLEVVPHIDTRRSTNFEGMFNGCIALKEIGGLDLRNSTQLNAMFYGCVALEKLNVKNINYSLTLGSVEAYSNLLETESLINLVYELHNSTSTKTVTMGAVNLAKLSNIYVKTIDITDEMRAEDEFVDLKIPFEVCESTDVGAMLITDYALTKKWRLQ